jgi:molybdenum cofactor cytidylyltransferase
MLAAVILAAGESRRMGRPKALIPYRGVTFAEHLLQITRHQRVGLTRLVLGAKAEELRAQLPVDPADVVINPNWELGQLSSIQAGVRSLPPGQTEGFVLCPVDHPLVSADLVAKLIEAFDASEKLIILPTYQGKRGHPAIFHASLYDELLAASAEVGARQVVWAHAGDVLEVPTNEEGSVLNLNDPDVLSRALKQERESSDFRQAQ